MTQDMTWLTRALTEDAASRGEAVCINCGKGLPPAYLSLKSSVDELLCSSCNGVDDLLSHKCSQCGTMTRGKACHSCGNNFHKGGKGGGGGGSGLRSQPNVNVETVKRHPSQEGPNGVKPGHSVLVTKNRTGQTIQSPSGLVAKERLQDTMGRSWWRVGPVGSGHPGEINEHDYLAIESAISPKKFDFGPGGGTIPRSKKYS